MPRSPPIRTPENLNQIRSDIESFLLTLPLGSDAAAADIEAAVAERLYEVAMRKGEGRGMAWREFGRILHLR
jgi:hypothetical protein